MDKYKKIKTVDDFESSKFDARVNEFLEQGYGLIRLSEFVLSTNTADRSCATGYFLAYLGLPKERKE